MKTKLAVFTTMLCLFAFGARAASLFQDNFDEYTTGPLTNQTGNITWAAHSGVAPINIVSDPTGNSANALQVSQALAQDIHANIDTNKTYADITVTNITFTTNIVVGVSTNITATTNFNYAYSPSNSVSTLYSSYTIYVTLAPPGGSSGGNQTYFGHFYTTSGGFDARLFLVTNGLAVATSGKFRIAIQNSGTALTNTVPVDLSVNTAYTIVTRYVLSSGVSTVWVNPINESTVTNVTPLDGPGTGNIMAYAFRQASAGEGTLDIDNFMTGTKFADVVPGSMNPPTILVQPNDTNVFSGANVTFSTLAAGDDVLSYQWFSVTNGVTNNIAGATGKILTLTGLTTNQTGLIFCMVTNNAGTNFTRSAALNVAAQPIPPIIDTNTTPAAATDTVGDTVIFSVVAHGLPAPAYQWKVVPATNNLVTNNVTGATSATLTLTSISTNQAGSYFVTITNSAGYLTTNSAKATLTVNPPPSVTISQLRSMVDPVTYANTNGTSLFTVEGIVTTWTNMTSSAAPEFYVQDSSGGIVVFWSGAGNSNTPPAGALVRVTAPFEFPIFDGLLTLEPVFTNTLESVTIISTNNPLPTPQPLPFDPNIQNNYPVMQALVGSYFVASNVMLNLSTPTFIANANDPTTNLAYHVHSDVSDAYNITFTNDVGQTFILFVNSHTDVTGQTKPTGPVTIYGVLGQFVSGSGPYVGGYEFTPSRFEDIIVYDHLTNIVRNVKRYGDLLTNSYSENVLRPGETQTTFESVGDPEGGIVTLTPVSAGLPTGAYWDGITSGSTASAVFHYKGTNVDAGNNFAVSLAASSTSGSTFTNSFTVYVPTLTEQGVAISEFLANPTTNAAALNFNPLHRGSDTGTITTNDEYVELANQSGNNVDTSSGANGWEVDQGNTQVMVFDALGSPPLISSSSAIVIYGGGSSPGLPVSSYAATAGKIGLPISGTGTIILRNGSGNIVDRVVYSGSDLNTNGSLTRFPDGINGRFVPQTYVSTNFNTAGLQYDGSAWNQPFKVPSGVNNVGISVVNGQVLFSFTANTGLASTLWGADTVNGPYTVLYGTQFMTTSGSFTNTPSGLVKFYYISNQ